MAIVIEDFYQAADTDQANPITVTVEIHKGEMPVLYDNNGEGYPGFPSYIEIIDSEPSVEYTDEDIYSLEQQLCC